MKPAAYTPGINHETGPDGRGWNRLSLNAHMMPAQERCMYRPKNGPAAWVVLHRGLLWQHSWTNFDTCVGSVCEGCPKRWRDDLQKPPKGAVIREDLARGVVWILPNREDGWDRFGYYYRNWEALCADWDLELYGPRHDEFGAYYATSK